METTALIGSHTVMDGEKEAGILEVLPQGGYLRFRAACRAPGQAMLRLVALGGEEKTADLGALVPRGELWSLDRRFSPAELRAMGLEEIRGCRLQRASPPGWTAEPDPGRLLGDELLRRLCRDVRGALTLRQEGETLLALPLTDPFPLLPVFCLGSVRTLEGRQYLVFSVFDGRLGMISPGEGQNRSGDLKNR